MMVIGVGSSWAQDEVVLLTENFDAAKVGDNTSTSGSGQSITAADFETLSESDKLYQAGGAVKIGTASAPGSFTTIALDLSQNEGNYIVEFDVKGWTNVEGDIIVTPSNGKAQTVKYSAVRTDANFETISLPFNGGEEATTIKIATSAKRAFIDNLKIYYKPSETQKITTSIVNPTAANSNGVINAELGMEDPFFGIFVINTADDSRIENPVLTYSSSNENVATIDENGDITLVGAGETTISATFAGDDTYYGSTGSYILKVTDPDAVPVNSFEEAFATATSTAADILFQFENVQVVGVNGNQVLIQDQEGHGAVIYQANHGFVAGNVLNGTVNCKYLTYGVGFLEFTGVSSSDVEVTNANEVAATPHSIGDLELINYGSLITIEGLTYAGNNVFTDATGASITMYNTFKISDFSDISLEEGEEYTVTGAYVLYGTTKEFAPRSTSDIVKTSIDDRTETYLTFDGVEYEDDEPVVYNELGEDFYAPTATLWDIEDNEIAGVVLNYESSDPDVAEVTPNGIKINGEGTAVITVSYDGSDVYQPCQLTYTIIVSANGGDEKQYPTYDIVDANQQPLSADQAPTIYVGEPFEFYVLTKAQGLSVTMEQNPNAEFSFDPETSKCTVTATDEGSITISISTEEDDVFYASDMELRIEAIYSQVGPQPTYNTVTWTLQNDQSTVSDDYAEWTHKDVKLTYEKNQSNTPVSQGVNADHGHTRFYANTTVSIVPSDGVEIAYVTFTTTGGKNVSADQPVDNGSVEVDGTAVKLTPTDGTKAMVLVMANQVRATDMTVYYTGEGTAPVEPTEVTINVTNEDGAPMDEKIVMTVGETKNFMVYASNQAPVTYSGDNDKVATVEAAAAFDGGIITAKAAGTMTITFTVDATSNQPSAEKKITVTVVEPQQPDLAGLTAETAFTVEEAIAAIKAGVDANTDYYVKGLISKVDEIATEQFFNATYWLADDMGADNQMLEVYRGKAFRGDGFNEGNASLVTVGNEVVVKGKLTYYETSDVYEFSSNSQLVSVKFDFLTVKSGDYGTICLPYDATVEGATVYEVAGVVKDDADNLSDLVLTEHEGNLLAGVPYVYKATADNIAVTYLASAIVTYGYGATGLQGTLAETPLQVEAGNYILYNNVLRKVGDDADAKIAKYHAYFNLTNVATFNPENTADVKYISISFDEDATGITELTEKTESTEGAIYNLQGQRVNSLQRGINIVGGKKVLVK